MAGITYRLSQSPKASGPAAAGSGNTLASVAATGPWVLTILSLAVISVSTRDLLDLETLAAFRTIVVYSFAISLVATAAITITATRMTADLLHLGRIEQVLASFVASLLAGAGLAALALAVLALSGLATLPGLATLVCSSTVAFVWIALAFSTALRDNRGILIAFCAGLAIATLGAVIAAQAGTGFTGMVAGFASGLFVIFLCLGYRILSEFHAPVRTVLRPLLAFLHFGRSHRLLALGATFAAGGVWVDKWIVWSGPEGETARSGLVHAPAYDGAMFIAYLSIIPCVILFVGILETSFTRDYRRFFLSIGAHATLQTIERNANDLAAGTLNALMRTARAQFIICLIFVMAAPDIVELSGLRYEDTGLLRVGAMGASFHFLFLACLSLLLFFERHKEFFQLGACHFILNSTFTAATLVAGTDYYGLGYLAAAVVSSLLAFAVVDRTIGQLTYLTFFSALHRDGVAPMESHDA